LETYLFIATYGASIEGDLLLGRHPGLYCAFKNRQQSRPAAFGSATPGKRQQAVAVAGGGLSALLSISATAIFRQIPINTYTDSP
jgi:hypothetical protein